AIDEAGPIAALAGEFIERHHPRYFPPVGQSEAGRKAQARERVAHVLVRSPGGRYEIGSRSSEQSPILIVDAERQITATKRVARDRGEETSLAAPGWRNERELLV